MILKSLKWTGIFLLIVVLGVATFTVARQNAKYDAPYPDVASSSEPALIERGRHLATGPAHCVECHSKVSDGNSKVPASQPVLSGGRLFALPIGDFYTPNITPDPETGIGKLSDREIARSLRYGVRADGTVLFDFMPFHNTSDEDLTAILSFLRSLPPQSNSVPKRDLNLIGKVLKAFLVKPVGPTGEVLKSIVPAATAEYGEYLAGSVANCNGCHTLRSEIGEYIGVPYAGGNPMEEPGKETLIPPNLTPHPEGRISLWTEEQFLKRFRLGKLVEHSHMPWGSFSKMSDLELKAIYRFLKSLKPAKNPE
ncbi:cytochrome C [Leptospira gomenensis]|uniref:Cytochrome C n=1 Tax=Leptospira gomenensis TaxID=2484974 RepID=A0A5F1YN43_9LEPT|nr:cytochrome C [Leptospira gomenensis]TGK35010.1 cytochrome C [Leptospira gomenensis]TGK35312.1 cytochrome C [Leptospira gomenensis]TGK51797.1 cytochrome C [Leptospira gomenensis]TGK58392.1 cytochrome C [Leptospira gomenensis]